MNTLLDKLGGRRFVMSMLIGFTTSLLVYLGKLDGTAYGMIIVGTVGAYIAGATVEKVKTNATL